MPRLFPSDISLRNRYRSRQVQRRGRREKSTTAGQGRSFRKLHSPGELRTAEWVHFALYAREWRIPAERMKMREGLIVPLSRQTMEVVEQLKPATERGRYLFPSLQSPGRAMSENTINAVLRRLGYRSDEITGHGFRAMARTILDEVLEVRVEWIEHQLAHEVRDPNGRAYNPTGFLEGRKKMMQA